MGDLNYDEIDLNVRGLVEVLNAAPGLRTIGSCGGHENPKRGGWKAPDWYVLFEIDRTDEGWLSLEFLAWAINGNRRLEGYNALLIPTSPPPYLNTPGRMLRFALEGNGDDPEEFACWLEEIVEECFIPKIMEEEDEPPAE